MVYVYFMFMDVSLALSLCTTCVPGSYEGLRILDLPELELEMVMSYQNI